MRWSTIKKIKSKNHNSARWLSAISSNRRGTYKKLISKVDYDIAENKKVSCKDLPSTTNGPIDFNQSTDLFIIDMSILLFPNIPSHSGVH